MTDRYPRSCRRVAYHPRDEAVSEHHPTEGVMLKKIIGWLAICFATSALAQELPLVNFDINSTKSSGNYITSNEEDITIRLSIKAGDVNKDLLKDADGVWADVLITVDLSRPYSSNEATPGLASSVAGADFVWPYPEDSHGGTYTLVGPDYVTDVVIDIIDDDEHEESENFYMEFSDARLALVDSRPVEPYIRATQSVTISANDEPEPPPALVGHAQTSVPHDWGLKPSGLNTGEQFRLIFLSSTKRDGSATDIATYNTFVQTRAAAGHTDIQAYSDGFTAVGCTEDVDAVDNTGTTGAGVPIYWLNGNKVADDYADFYDETWDEERNNRDRDESGNTGPDTSQSGNYPITGCDHDGTESFAGGSNSAALGTSNWRLGRPNSSTLGHGPLGGGATASSGSHPMYGLSEVFEVSAPTHREIWSATLTVAEISVAGSTFGYGFTDATSQGSLSEDEFTYYGTDYSTVLFYRNTDTDPDLWLGFDPQGATAFDNEELSLVVDGTAFSFGDAVFSTGQWVWAESGLNWADGDTVAVRLLGPLPPPVALVSATVSGTALTLTYDTGMDETSVPAASAYAVDVDSTAATVSSVAVAGPEVTLTLASAPAATATTTVGYVVPATNPLRSLPAAIVPTFSDQPVAHVVDLVRNRSKVASFALGLVGTLSGEYLAVAQQFDTGGNAAGYLLDSVLLDLLSVEANTDPRVSIYTTSGSNPGTLVHTLANPSGVADGWRTFTAPPGALLGKDTDYFVVVEHTGTTETFTIGLTASDAEDSGKADGWGIANTRRESVDGTWGAISSSDVVRIHVQGAIIPNRLATGAPAITGTAAVGQTLAAATAGISDPDGTTKAEAGDTGYAYTYQWIRVDSDGSSNATDISGATASTYVLASADEGKKIKLEAAFTDDADSDEGPLTSAAYPPTGTVAAGVTNNLATGTPTISGTAQAREPLTAGMGNIADADGLPATFPDDYTFQWLRVDADGVSNQTNIGAPLASITLAALEVGKKVKVQVSFTDDGGTGEARTSNAFPSSGTITAATLPELSFANTNITVDEDAGTVTLTVELDPASAGTVTVDFATSDQTALAGVDYTAASGTLTFAASETSKTIAVPILNDTAYDPTQRFRVTLNNASGATLPTSPWAFVHITNDDAVPTASIANVTVGEGVGTLTLTLALDRLSNGDITYSTATASVSGTATVADDYVAFLQGGNRDFTVPAGNLSQAFNITVVDDSLGETDETIVIVWHKDSGSSATPASIAFTGTIADNDTAGVTLSKSTLTVTEQDTTGDSYTVVLDSEPTADVVVTVAGHAGTDVTATSTPLTFTTANWSTAQVVTVTAADDADTTDDTVVLTHSAASTDSDYDGIAIANVTVTVEDNDTAQVTGVTVDPAATMHLLVGWTRVSNATGYQIQWKSGGEGYSISRQVDIISNPNTSSELISGFTNGTEYTMRVRAVRSGANNGPWSDDAMGTPEVPTALGVTLSKTALTVTEEDATGDSYTVVLDSEPTADVTVTVAGHAGTDVTATSTPLTFTTVNWSTAQVVTVTAADDADTTDDTVVLTHSAASTDSDYEGIAIANVTVTVEDNDSTAAVTPPALVSATVSGTALTLTYDKNLDEDSVPAAGTYAVDVDGTTTTVSSVAVDGIEATLTLASAPASTATTTVDYVVPATNPLRSTAEVDAPAFSGQPVAHIVDLVRNRSQGVVAGR